MKYILLTTFNWAICMKIFGQSLITKIGFETGPGVTSFRGNENLDKYFKPAEGFTAGFSYQFNSKNTINIRTGVVFERKKNTGYIVLDDNMGTFMEVFYKDYYNYLTVPIALRKHFGRKKVFFINAGAFFGYLLKQNEIITGTPPLQPSNTNNTNRFKHVDFGVSGGLGLLLALNSTTELSVEIRNNLGLQNLSKLPVINNDAIKSNATYLLIGLNRKINTKSKPKEKPSK
jgi:Outer membrane protein beta-barrel domain